MVLGRNRRVALEAIHTGAGKAVATLAELTFGVDRDGGTLGILLHVATDATHQTVFGATDTTVHRVVPLMREKLHVIAAHDVVGLDASLAHGRRNYR